MKTLEKDVFSSCHERGTKEKFWVPLRKRTLDIRIPRSDAMPLSHRDSTMSEVYYEVHIFSLSHVRDKKKKIFLYFFTELKTYVPSLLFLYKENFIPRGYSCTTNPYRMTNYALNVSIVRKLFCVYKATLV